MAEWPVVCPDSDRTIPLVDRLTKHAYGLPGDGCWRELLAQAVDAIERTNEIVAAAREHHEACGRGDDEARKASAYVRLDKALRAYQSDEPKGA